MKKKFFIIVVVILVIIGGLFLFIDRGISNVVSDETKDLIEEYVKREYKINCKIKSSTFSHYDEGITGGLYMYDFVCVDQKFKEIKISYSSYIDLGSDTIDNLKVEK